MTARIAVKPVELRTEMGGVSTGVDGAHGRLPVLDGVRAVAILLVLVSHVIISHHGLASRLVGKFGVSIFLVLSGFLITRVMLLDEARTGSLRIMRFYRRRALRILPASYAFLAILAGASVIGIVGQIPKEDWLAAILYSRNLMGRSWETGHLWSLSLEEQFYFLWPVAFLLTRRWRACAIVCIVAALTVHRVHWLASHQALATMVGFETLQCRTDLRIDTFLIGAVFSMCPRIRATRMCELCACGAVAWFYCAATSARLMPYETAGTATLLGICITSLVDQPSRLASRILSHPALVLIGATSYSLYLWQQLFLNPSHGLHWWTFPGLGLAAYGSYRFVELPFLRMKEAGKFMSLDADRKLLRTPA